MFVTHSLPPLPFTNFCQFAAARWAVARMCLTTNHMKLGFNQDVGRRWHHHHPDRSNLKLFCLLQGTWAAPGTQSEGSPLLKRTCDGTLAKGSWAPLHMGTISWPLDDDNAADLNSNGHDHMKSPVGTFLTGIQWVVMALHKPWQIKLSSWLTFWSIPSQNEAVNGCKHSDDERGRAKNVWGYALASPWHCWQWLPLSLQ